MDANNKTYAAYMALPTDAREALAEQFTQFTAGIVPEHVFAMLIDEVMNPSSSLRLSLGLGPILTAAEREAKRAERAAERAEQKKQAKLAEREAKRAERERRVEQAKQAKRDRHAERQAMWRRHKAERADLEDRQARERAEFEAQ
jgi:hypothetical protein